MNQEEVVRRLLELEENVRDFTVTFTGKTSKKTDSLYRPESAEIIIHNHNMTDDNGIMYAAIREYAKHIQFGTAPDPSAVKAGSHAYYGLFHSLLEKAQEMGIYINVFDKEPEFLDLTKRIKEQFLSVNGQLMKDFGGALIEAERLCEKYHASFDDYVNRILGVNRTSARSAIKVKTMDIEPSIGFDSMKTVAAIKDDDIRQLAQEALMTGRSPEIVKQEFSPDPPVPGKMEYLKREKERLEKTLDELTARLAKVERELEALRFEEQEK